MEKVFAQNLTLPDGSSVAGPIKTFTTLTGAINIAVGIIIAFAGIGLLLMIIAAGYGMLTSAGDPKKMEGAKQRLTNGLIGFFIIIFAYWITQLLGTIFGITQITDLFNN